MFFGCADVTVAQTPLLDDFNPGADGPVYSLAVQADGKILLGGSFTTLGGQPHSYIGRLNPDGSVDAAFEPGASKSVDSLSVQADGKILLGGSFTTLGGQPHNYIGRLNPDGTVDTAFNPGANNQVLSVAVQADEKIIIGGTFTSVGGQSRTNLARLNADGTLDSEFKPWVDRFPGPLAMQVDGRILLGGFFSSVCGQSRTNLARLNADGTLDATFNPGVGGWVRSLAVLADGKIVVGGRFTTLGGQPRNDLGRLNPDGTVDPAFSPGAFGQVYSLAVQTDGKILVNGIARWNPDGTLDARFKPPGVLNGAVFSLALQTDGKIVLGGDFTTVGGSRRSRIARLNNTEPATESLSYAGSIVSWLRGGTGSEVWRTTFELSRDGSTWSSIGAGTHISGGWQLTGIPLPPGGTIRVRGYTSSSFLESFVGAPILQEQPASVTRNAGEVASFSCKAAGSEPLNYQWRKDGEVLVGGARIAGATTPRLSVKSLLKSDEGDYVVTVLNGYGGATSMVARLTVNEPGITEQPASLNKGLGESATLRVTAVGTGSLYYQWMKDGSPMPSANDASLLLSNLAASDAGAYSVVVSNAYGNVISTQAFLTVNSATLDRGVDGWSMPDDDVLSLALQPDGKILVGGNFTWMGQVPRDSIGRLNPDGSLDGGFSPEAEGEGSPAVTALAVQNDGKILVGGWFTTLGGVLRNNIGRLNPDGSLDVLFNPSVNGGLNSLAVLADGKILVAGGGEELEVFNADGTIDSHFNPQVHGDGFLADMFSLAPQADGKILVGGRFTRMGGQSRTNLARLNADGTLDSEFKSWADFIVNSLAVQADGGILLGGLFSSVGGQSRTNLARLNADGTLDAAFNTGANGQVRALALQANGKILVGGRFTSVGGQPRTNIARLNVNGTLDLGFSPRVGDNQYSFVSSLALQADGKVLLGGGNASLWWAGPLVRVDNTEQATQSLAWDGTNITWLRGGSSPEVWRTTLDVTTNGASWITVTNGIRIPAGWAIRPTFPPTVGKMRVRGQVACASGWFLDALIVQPLLMSHPNSRTNDAGTEAMFGCLVGGAEPLSLQWRKDGVPLNDGEHITGANTPQLTMRNVLGGDAGGYTLLVSNAAGSVASAVSSLKVIDPFIIEQPVNHQASLGETVAFTVAVEGTIPNYQWRKDGALLVDGGRIAGAATATLSVAGLVQADEGNYDVMISNRYGSVTSAAAELTVRLPVVDAQFNPDSDGSVYLMGLQTDGKILLGGEFDTLNGRPRANFARLNPDGTLDPAFDAGAGGASSPEVNSLAIQADGKILVGGEFTTLGGQPRNSIGRLNSDGTLDTGFNPGAGEGVNPSYPYVMSLTVLADEKILVGGYFRKLAGVPRNNIGQLNANGTLFPGFSPRVDQEYYWVYALALQGDGKIVVGGDFTEVGGQMRDRIARLEANGSLDLGFDPGVSGGSNPLVKSLAVQADGKILVGGEFTIAGGQPRTNIARLNPDGKLDPGFNPSANGIVSSLKIQADGKILVGGEFTTLGNRGCNYIGRLNPDGTVDSRFDAAPDNRVDALTVQPDGKILVGGMFTMLAGQPHHRIARLNNTAPASQSLSYDGATVMWLRGGSSPEVWRTTFDVSPDGANWTRLGVGTRVAGGWQLASVQVAPGAQIRARGYVTGDSGWFVESIWPAAAGPVLAVELTESGVSLTWPITAVGFMVEEVESLSPPAKWRPVAERPTTESNRYRLTIVPARAAVYYRLAQ